MATKLTGKKNGRYKTGLRMAGVNSSLYNTWQAMKQRVLNPRHPKYHRYGGRGITLHPDWMDILGFKRWAEAAGHKEGSCIDRIDNDGNYTPENCQWISQESSSRKKSTTKLTKEQAEEIRLKHTRGAKITELAEQYGVVPGTIWFVVNNVTHVADGECTKKLKRLKTTT